MQDHLLVPSRTICSACSRLSMCVSGSTENVVLKRRQSLHSSAFEQKKVETGFLDRRRCSSPSFCLNPIEKGDWKKSPIKILLWFCEFQRVLGFGWLKVVEKRWILDTWLGISGARLDTPRLRVQRSWHLRFLRGEPPVRRVIVKLTWLRRTAILWPRTVDPE